MIISHFPTKNAKKECLPLDGSGVMTGFIQGGAVREDMGRGSELYILLNFGNRDHFSFEKYTTNMKETAVGLKLMEPDIYVEYPYTAVTLDNVATPTHAYCAANKLYVDAAIQSAVGDIETLLQEI